MTRERQATSMATEPPAREQDPRAVLVPLAQEVLALLRHYTRDPHLAADLTQDTMAQAMGALHRLRDRAALRSWVLRIAVNRFNDHLRESAARRRSPPPGRPRSPRDPQREVLARELDEVLREEVLQLPDRQRSVLILHGLEGLDQASIARILEMTPGAVKMALYRGRERLRHRLGRYLGRPLREEGPRP